MDVSPSLAVGREAGVRDIPRSGERIGMGAKPDERWGKSLTLPSPDRGRGFSAITLRDRLFHNVEPGALPERPTAPQCRIRRPAGTIDLRSIVDRNVDPVPTL